MSTPLALLLAAALFASEPPTWPEGVSASAVASVGITVADLDRSLAFFTEVLEFELVGADELAGPQRESLEGVFGLRQRVAQLKLGDERVELTEYLAPRGQPIPLDSRSNDRWFQHIALVVEDVGEAYAWLRSKRVEHSSSGPQRLPDWNPNAGGIEAFYFKDPDGHVLEILSFPPDKGDEKWRHVARESGRRFLGIDHTAIVVDDTEASLRFYRDTLGLRVAGESENSGTEQDHLNNVFGARLRITGLRAPAGPGIELLEYLAPSGGRPYPEGARSNDLVHWEVRLLVDDLEASEGALRASRAHFVSAGPVELAPNLAALLVRDPDGHAVELWNTTEVVTGAAK